MDRHCFGGGHGAGRGGWGFDPAGGGAWFWGGHGRGRGGPFRRGRVFEQGDLKYVILKLLAEKPRHGYEIIKELEEQFGGAYSPSAGTVYPTLTLLEDLGYASVIPEEGGKKVYSITPEGQKYLEENKRRGRGHLRAHLRLRVKHLRRVYDGGKPGIWTRCSRHLHDSTVAVWRQKHRQ